MVEYIQNWFSILLFDTNADNLKIRGATREFPTKISDRNYSGPVFVYPFARKNAA